MCVTGVCIRHLIYRIERTAKGWELAGVPQRVLDEFSRRTEQVEQKAKELGITSAKGKDGLAALTRERKQKELSKANLRGLWGQRVSADERRVVENILAQSRSERPRVSEMKAMDFSVQHCYERAWLFNFIKTSRASDAARG